MSIRVLKLKANNRAHINRVNRKKMLGLSYVKKGCCPESIPPSRLQGKEPCSDNVNNGQIIKRTVILKKGDVISYRQGTENLKSCIWSAPAGTSAQIKITYFKSEYTWDFLSLYDDINKILDFYSYSYTATANTHWINVDSGIDPPSNSPFARVLTGTGPYDNTEIITGIRAIQFTSDSSVQEDDAGVNFEVVDIIGDPPEPKFIQPIQSLSYHNYLKTAHNFKKNNNKCCDSNGKLVKRVKRLTYKRQPKTDSSLYIENKKSKALFCKFKSTNCESGTACGPQGGLAGGGNQPTYAEAGNYILANKEKIKYRQTKNRTNCVWTTPIGVKATITFTYFLSEGEGSNTKDNSGNPVRGWDFLNIFSDRNNITTCFGPEEVNDGCINAGDLGSFSGTFQDYPKVTILPDGSVKFENVEAIQFISDWDAIETDAGIDFSVKYTQDSRIDYECVYNNINRGRLSCKKRNEIKSYKDKKVKTLDFVSAGDYIASKKANRKKANGDKYETKLMDSNQCSIKSNRVLL